MKNSQNGFATTLIVILLVLALGGGVYMYSINKNVVPVNKIETVPEVSTSKTTETRQEVQINPGQKAPVSSTGIILTSIKSYDLVKLPITVEGYLDGNGWSANEGEVGLVEVFDANGKSISNKELVRTTSDWLKFPTYFKATVGDREMMSNIKTNSGSIKITSNTSKDGEQSKSISIPVRFR